jgi:hypothetical protein
VLRILTSNISSKDSLVSKQQHDTMTEGSSILERGTWAMRDGAKWLGLLRILDEDAEKVTIYGPVNNQKEVVASTHLMYWQYFKSTNKKQLLAW